MKRSLRVTFRRQCSRRSAHVSQRRGVGLLILKRRREPRSTVRFVLLLNLAFKNCPMMPFDEVMAKSMCRPMEQLVEVGQEHPGQVQYIYIPACVALWRCSGCCGDENLECQASLLSNTTLQVMRIHQMVSMHHVELTFEEHQKCECSSSESIKNKHEKTASSCVNCRFPQKQMDLH
uniref:Platelet-derived growth factor (PDGF) family profile domain-containing protein n=1 Tax=Gasterosteus aculeatus aculeatus TaxID=481459 RepID=A0AAQ4Q4A9_GASAC